MKNITLSKAIFKSPLKKILGARNYKRVVLTVRYIFSIYKKIVQKSKYIRFIIKGQILKRPVRILLTRYGGLGDILLSTPVIKQLKFVYPNSYIIYDTSENGIQLLEENQDIDEISVHNAGALKKTSDWHWHFTYEYYPDLHIIDGYLKWLGLNKNISKQNKIAVLNFTNSERMFADDTVKSLGINENEKVMGLCVQAGRKNRRWPLSYFSEVVEYMQKKFHFRVIEFGSKDQPHLGKDIDIVGKYSIRQSAAILAKCDFILCNDSLFLHIAGAINIPVVAIFGPAIPELRLPFNNISKSVYPKQGCRGCIHKKAKPQLNGTDCSKSFFECIESIKPEEVIMTIEDLISNVIENKS